MSASSVNMTSSIAAPRARVLRRTRLTGRPADFAHVSGASDRSGGGGGNRHGPRSRLATRDGTH